MWRWMTRQTNKCFLMPRECRSSDCRKLGKDSRSYSSIAHGVGGREEAGRRGGGLAGLVYLSGLSPKMFCTKGQQRRQRDKG